MAPRHTVIDADEPSVAATAFDSYRRLAGQGFEPR